MERKYTAKEILLALIPRYARYNVVELTFLLGYLIGYLNGGVWPAALWFGFVLSALWTTIMSTDGTYRCARDSVWGGDLYIGDFLSGVVVYCLLALVVYGEPWYFPVMFLLAAAQHLRYTYLSIQWKVSKEKLHGD